MSWTRDDMARLGALHADLEARGELEPLLETLVADPLYEFHPLGRGMRGGPVVRRFYTQFVERFLPLRHDYRLLAEWVSEDSVAQEYDITLRVDGALETHRVLGMGIVGPGAGELIAEGVLAIEMAAVAEDLAVTIHAHPTLSETVMESAENLFGHSTHIYRKPRRKKG